MNGQFLLFSYYNFVEKYKREPKDFDDLFDGIQVICTNNKIEEYYIKKANNSNG
jgi:hypothetical protein